MEMDYKIIIEKNGNKDNWRKKIVHWSVRLSFGECCHDNRSNTGQAWRGPTASHQSKKEPVYCYHKAGKTEWWRTVEVSSCVIVIFFFILVAWSVDLTYRYVIDKNIFFGKNLSSLWRWMLQIETRKNQLIFNWLLAV